jgi:hypothetical protein
MFFSLEYLFLIIRNDIESMLPVLGTIVHRKIRMYKIVFLLLSLTSTQTSYIASTIVDALKGYLM